MSSGQSKAADTARDEVDAFNQKYPVGSRVMVKSLKENYSASGAEVVGEAYKGGPNTIGAAVYDVCVRVRFNQDKPGLDHVIDASRVIGLDRRPPLPAPPVPSEPPVPEEGTRTWSEFFNESRYEVRHEVGTDKISVLYKGKAEPVSDTLVFFMLQTIRSLRSYLATAKQTIRDLRAELAEAKAPQTEIPEPVGLPLSDLCALLGWQGGTIHQVREEIVARRSVVERLAVILCKDDEKASYVESLHGPVEAVVWAAKETLKKLERAIQTNRAARVFLCATDREALEDAAARVVAERDDLRAQLAKTPQAETPTPEPEEDPALAILREVRDHQVHGHAIDPDDHLVVYCRARGDVLVNGLSPVVWSRNGEALAEATMYVANAGRRGADRYEVTTLAEYLVDCRAKAAAEDFSPAFAHRLTEPADTNPAPWPVPFAMPPVDSVMAPDLFFAARFDEVRRRAQRDLDRRDEEDEAPCDHTPWETARDGVVCKTCRVPMRFIGPGQGWKPVPGASAQVGESEGT